MILAPTLSEGVRRRGFERARRALTLAKPGMDNFGKAELRRLLSRDEIQSLSASDMPEFVRQYFPKNLVKASVAFEMFSEQFKIGRRVVDIGTGPGTFLFALSVSSPNTNDFVGIDISPPALEVANQMFELSAVPKPLLISGSVPKSIVSGGRFFVSSYLLSELGLTDKMDFLNWLWSRLDAQFLIVDYPDLIDELVSATSTYRPCSARFVRLQLPQDIARVVGDGEISFGVAFAPVAWRSSRSVQKRLV